MAQRGQRKRAVQAQLGVREAGLPVVLVCVCVYATVGGTWNERINNRQSERGMYVCEGVCVLKE